MPYDLKTSQLSFQCDFRKFNQVHFELNVEFIDIGPKHLAYVIWLIFKSVNLLDYDAIGPINCKILQYI